MATHGDPEFTQRLKGERSFDDLPSHPERPTPPSASVRGPAAVTFAGALLGSVFAALSTNDFMQHLDRQVHAIHCSFLPGAAKEITESGCRTVMMSPYSSFFRESLWGGIPISLWALAVFAFLAYRSGLIFWRGRATRGETGFLLAASALPVVMSIVFGAVSLVILDASCKVCIGIYAASALCFVGALLAHRRKHATPAFGSAWDRFPGGLVEGVAFVALLTVAYVTLVPKPDPNKSLTGCGWLVQAEDPAGVMIPLESGLGGTPSIELLDPLCPSCRAFETRLSASSLRNRLDLKGVLFPLDSACNWMVTEAVHPGACAVSEAVLCAAGLERGLKNGPAARRVLHWAFEHQEELRSMAAKDESALRAHLAQQFPGLKGCLGGALVKSKLTKGLRWAVANAVPVLTPQLFVGESRMCDEDTDLGLEYTLSRMLSPEAEHERARRRLVQPPPPPARTPPSEPIAAVHPAASQQETPSDAQGTSFAPARTDVPAAGPSRAKGPSPAAPNLGSAAREAPPENNGTPISGSPQSDDPMEERAAPTEQPSSEESQQ